MRVKVRVKVRDGGGDGGVGLDTNLYDSKEIN